MTLGHFVPMALSPHNLTEILSGVEHSEPPWWSSSLPSLLAVQQALGWYLAFHTNFGWISLARYGYVILRWDLLCEIIDLTRVSR